MGKVDDMRRLREAQHSQAAASSKAAGTAASPPAASAKAAASPPAASAKAATDEVGTCSGCGKQKPLQRGVIANHQKGLRAVCPGSRKPPA